MRVLVTGGCGFIGSAVVRHLIERTDHEVCNVDKMSYASTHGSVADAAADDRYSFSQTDVTDSAALDALFASWKPDSVIHLAAESHVDRSIDGPGEFIHTNVIGTFALLQAARAHGVARFHHVSTDEVYGSLDLEAPGFTETTAYDPRSPYSASKAASDHLVRAWGETYDLGVVVTNCSNNYGPFQFPEKLIPLVTLRALAGDPLPVYGRGDNVRDWLFVEDHADALVRVLEHGVDGRTYNIGGNSERTNLEVVHKICDLLDELVPANQSRRSLVHFVEDRPGHDLRYAIDQTRIRTELGWEPSVSFDDGLRDTIQWYLDNESWWAPLVAQATARQGLGSS